VLRNCLLGLLCAGLFSGPLEAQDAGALRARHAQLREALAANAFGRPLHVESSEASGKQAGEVYAIVERPYDAVAPALQRVDQWCGILILPANVQRCVASGTGEALSLFIARKPHDPLEDAYRVDLRFEVAAAGPDYLRVALGSPSGPFGTADYRIGVEAAPLDARRTLVHMSYSYALGLMARIALQGYLATSGRHKVGFSIVERDADGRPLYIGGTRGMLERNTMRYYLALEAYLDSLDAPPAQRLERRLRAWYAGIERYPLQLQEELSREEYLRLKRSRSR
jgi:hypothetical protein